MSLMKPNRITSPLEATVTHPYITRMCRRKLLLTDPPDLLIYCHHQTQSQTHNTPGSAVYRALSSYFSHLFSEILFFQTFFLPLKLHHHKVIATHLIFGHCGVAILALMEFFHMKMGTIFYIHPLHHLNLLSFNYLKD